MTLTPIRVTEITKAIVKKAFFNYFLCREEVGTKHVVLSRFFPEESVVRSAIGRIDLGLGFQTLTLCCRLERHYKPTV